VPEKFERIEIKHGGTGKRIVSLRLAGTKLVRPYFGNENKNKSAGDIDEVVEHLLRKYEVLGSITSTEEKKKALG
jgi:hypothetical protein